MVRGDPSASEDKLDIVRFRLFFGLDDVRGFRFSVLKISEINWKSTRMKIGVGVGAGLRGARKN